MIQTIIRDIGGTLETYFEDGRPATCTITLYDADGGKKVDAAAATVDTVATTLGASTTVGARTVTLADATGVVCGRRYLIGAFGSTAAHEHVTVKTLDVSTATLYAPMLLAHSSGCAFTGCRVSYAVTSTQADALWTNGHAMFTPASGDPITETVHCVRSKIPVYLADMTDVRLVYSNIDALLSKNLDIPAALTSARDGVLMDIGAKIDQVHALLTSSALRRLVALRFIMERAPEMGENGTPIVKPAADEYEARMSKLLSQLPVDGDQDGSVTGADDKQFGGLTELRIYRAG